MPTTALQKAAVPMTSEKICPETFFESDCEGHDDLEKDSSLRIYVIDFAYPEGHPLRSYNLPSYPQNEPSYLGIGFALYDFHPENDNEFPLSQGQDVFIYEHGNVSQSPHKKFGHSANTHIYIGLGYCTRSKRVFRISP